jgi:hypothetical protein
MTFAASLRQLTTQQTLLDEALAALHVTLCEDRPAGTAPALLDRFENIVTELRGGATELADHLQSLQTTARSALDAERLGQIHELVLRMERCYWHELAAYAAFGELMRMGHERGRAWQAWSQVVLKATQACSPPLEGTHSALLECWSGFAERRLPLATVTSLSKPQPVRLARMPGPIADQP